MQDRELLVYLRNNSEQAMTDLYRRYYAFLCSIAYNQCNDKNVAQDFVQEVMMDVWNRRTSLKVTTDLQSYLAKAIFYKTIRHNKSVKLLQLQEEHSLLSYEIENASGKKLSEHIEQAVQKLPERPRECFIMSRDEGLTYKEIGDALDISPKTVDHHISKALKLLREMIKVFMNSNM